VYAWSTGVIGARLGTIPLAGAHTLWFTHDGKHLDVLAEDGCARVYRKADLMLLQTWTGAALGIGPRIDVMVESGHSQNVYFGGGLGIAVMLAQ